MAARWPETQRANPTICRPPEVVNALAKAYEHVYAENYTEDQLRGLIEFHRSPLEHTFAQNNLK